MITGDVGCGIELATHAYKASALAFRPPIRAFRVMTRTGVGHLTQVVKTGQDQYHDNQIKT